MGTLHGGGYLVPSARGRAKGVGEGYVLSVGEHPLHGFRVAFDELAQRELAPLEDFVEIIYRAQPDAPLPETCPIAELRNGSMPGSAQHLYSKWLIRGSGVIQVRGRLLQWSLDFRGERGMLGPTEKEEDTHFEGNTDVREHLANERTLLAWVRTGVGLISVGFVVERTGALALVKAPGMGSAQASEVFGLSLVVLGIITLVLGTIQFLRNRRRILDKDFTPSVAIYLAVIAGSLALAAAFIVYALL